nr:BTB/POZ domain-containing protein 6-like [Aedes albopictus]
MDNDPPKFAFDSAPPIARLERLLLSEYMSDVIFEVGTISRELIHAHKVILTLASEVFFAQFNGNFDESNRDNRAKPIAVPDIEPATFREVMRYIYTEKVNITGTNAIDLFYAAQKYMMNTLKGKCESFLKTPGNETKVLEVIDSNTKYGLTEVDQLCLRLIQENPLLYFNSDDFISLSKRTIGMIAGCESMNCKTEHIHNAIEKWRKANNVSAEFKIELKDLQCHKLHFFGYFSYVPQTETSMWKEICICMVLGFSSGNPQKRIRTAMK